VGLELNRTKLGQCRRIVVKLGTGLIAYPSGKLRLDFMEQIVRQLADLKHDNRQVILVSSGAVGAGMGRLGIATRPISTVDKQAVAAVGQGILIQIYEKLFAEYGCLSAQVLLTRSDLMARHRYLNARNTLIKLLDYGAIPVINENDTVSVEEIEFGDNDTLSALVAGLIDADLLIILSDVSGLFTGNPYKEEKAELIEKVEEITPEIRRLAGANIDQRTTGGMITKIHAAEIATACGIPMIIAAGDEKRVLRRVLDGESIGTIFLPKSQPLPGRKRWISFAHSGQGIIRVDEGAAKAIVERGKSLLPSGITSLEGSFNRGEMVSVVAPDGREIARGLVNYSVEELKKIKGLQTGEIAQALGYPGIDEIIHRDNMVYLDFKD